MMNTLVTALEVIMISVTDFFMAVSIFFRQNTWNVKKLLNRIKNQVPIHI